MRACNCKRCRPTRMDRFYDAAADVAMVTFGLLCVCAIFVVFVWAIAPELFS